MGDFSGGIQTEEQIDTDETAAFKLEMTHEIKRDFKDDISKICQSIIAIPEEGNPFLEEVVLNMICSKRSKEDIKLVLEDYLVRSDVEDFLAQLDKSIETLTCRHAIFDVGDFTDKYQMVIGFVMLLLAGVTISALAYLGVGIPSLS